MKRPVTTLPTSSLFLRKDAGFHEILPVAGREGAGREKEVGLLQGACDLKGGHMVGLEPRRIEGDPDLSFLSADEGELRYILVLLDLVAEFGADPPEFIAGIAVAVAPEGQGEDRHVVDGPLLDQRRGDARRYPVVSWPTACC